MSNKRKATPDTRPQFASFETETTYNYLLSLDDPAVHEVLNVSAPDWQIANWLHHHLVTQDAFQQGGYLAALLRTALIHVNWLELVPMLRQHWLNEQSVEQQVA